MLYNVVSNGPCLVTFVQKWADVTADSVTGDSRSRPDQSYDCAASVETTTHVLKEEEVRSSPQR